MIDLDRLLELIDKGLWGVHCGCQTTKVAYWKMADIEIFRLMRSGSYKDQEKMAAAYKHLATLREKETSISGELEVMVAFWDGFDDGQHERTLPRRARRGYRHGYHFGKRS